MRLYRFVLRMIFSRTDRLKVSNLSWNYNSLKRKYSITQGSSTRISMHGPAVQSPCCRSRTHWKTADPGTPDPRRAARYRPLNPSKNSDPSFQLGLMCELWGPPSSLRYDVRLLTGSPFPWFFRPLSACDWRIGWLPTSSAVSPGSPLKTRRQWQPWLAAS